MVLCLICFTIDLCCCFSVYAVLGFALCWLALVDCWCFMLLCFFVVDLVITGGFKVLLVVFGFSVCF